MFTKNHHLQVKIAKNTDGSEETNPYIKPWMTPNEAHNFAKGVTKGLVVGAVTLMTVHFIGNIAQDTISQTVEHLLKK